MDPTNPMMMEENQFQLAIIDLVFGIFELFTNIITGVLLPGVLTPFFQAIFSLFQPA